MAALHLLPAADRIPTAWKNGGGRTSEVIVWPEGAPLGDFEWRISIADIENDGPFSHFPDTDRTLCILSGAGIFLDVGGRLQKLTPRSVPFRFAGDVPCRARLLDGPISDLNIMSRRGRIEHRVIRLGGGDGLAAKITAPLALAIWVEGLGSLETPAGKVNLAPRDAVLCRQPGRWQIGKGALAYLVSLGSTG
jgi:environmental stress-induced protein Ves